VTVFEKNVSEVVFPDNQYGSSLVTGLLRYVSTVTQAKGTELVEMCVSFAVLPWLLKFRYSSVQESQSSSYSLI
jgi:hypothetical protein